MLVASWNCYIATMTQPRKPQDNRKLSDQYQHTQADTLLAHEHLRDADERRRRKRWHWFFSLAFVTLFFLLAYKLALD